MTDSNSSVTQFDTLEVSPFSKSKCLRMLREAYGPTARIMQKPGIMTLVCDNRELFNVSGAHTGLPWALVQIGYDRLGFKCFIEQGKVFVTVKERVKNDGPNEEVQGVRATETRDELRPVEGEVSAPHVSQVPGQEGIVKL